MWLGAVVAVGAPIIVSSAAPSAALPSCPRAEVVFARGTGELPGIGRVGQALVESLRLRLGEEQVAMYAVDYPATRDFIRAVDGAMDARARVEATSASCPSTAIVLGGYSQGAAVIDLIAAPEDGLFGFARPLPANVADHVAAVTVFGNPSNRFGRALNDWSLVYGAKTIDLCNDADPVCSGGNDVSAHSLYVESGLADQAAEFVVNHLQAPKSPT
jgi:cutinase